MENSTYKKYHDKVCINFYHLDPRYTSHKDFDYMLEQGYVNCLRLSTDGVATTVYGCKKAKEYGFPVWIVPPCYIPEKETLEEFVAGIEKYVEKLKKEDVWDAVVGFQWDEPLLRRGHTNEALYEMTKAVSETFGKRIFVNFSLYEIAGKRGNDGDPDFQWLLKKESSKYFTDVGFDLYGVDMRPENQDKLKAYLEKVGKQENVVLNNGTELYQHYTDVMLNLMENPDKVRVWYYPCAYESGAHGGIHVDEGYCEGHLKGFYDLLMKQKNPGGICVFTYKLFLDWHLSPKNPDKWVQYDKTCKKICENLSQIEINK